MEIHSLATLWVVTYETILLYIMLAENLTLNAREETEVRLLLGARTEHLIFQQDFCSVSDCQSTLQPSLPSYGD